VKILSFKSFNKKKGKRKEEKKVSPLSIESRTPASQTGIHTATLGTLPLRGAVNFATHFFPRDKMLWTGTCWCFSWENVFGPPQKPWSSSEKKNRSTSSAIFGVRTAAKCFELKCCADRVRSRTDNKDEVLKGKFSNLNFSPSTKKRADRYLISCLSFKLSN